MVKTYTAAPDIEVITADFPIPGYGLVPINSFVLKGSEPILVDTGAVVHKEEFMPVLRSVIDPSELEWIWISHTDFDHVGSLPQLLEECPRARVLTTFLGVGIMSLADPLPLDRVHLLNPGETIAIGDRMLTALRPPTFDNPSTTGFYDNRSGALFSSDCFGALLSAVPENAADLSDQELRDGQVFWATLDAPWVHNVDGAAFEKELDNIRKMAPQMVLSSHLPAASGDMTERLLSSLAAARTAAPFVGPNQAGLEQMLAQMTAGG